MIRQDIVDYIKAQIEKGQTKEEIKNALASVGWQMADIEEAFRYAEQNISVPPALNNVPYFDQTGQDSQNTAILKSPTDLLKEAWGIYKARFKTFIGISLVPVVAMLIFSILMLIIVYLTILPGKGIVDSSRFFAAYGIAFFVIFIPIIILHFWSQAAMLYAVKDSDENIGAKESYRRGRHKILSVFWVGLLSGFIIMGGFLFFVIPGIIFSTWFSFAIMIVVAEDLGGMNALLKSKSYVTGYWWKIFWRFLFIGLVLFLINLIFLIPSWIINFIAQIANSSALIMIGAVINFAGSIVGFLLAPLTIVYTFLVYKNLKEIKGEINPVFTSGQKIKYILAGLFGIIFMIGFIILVFLASLTTGTPKSLDAQRQSDIASIQPALEVYYDNHNNIYPVSLNQLVEEYSLSMPMPRDPKTKLPYEYRQLKSGKDFELCAKLENGARKCLNSLGSLLE